MTTNSGSIYVLPPYIAHTRNVKGVTVQKMRMYATDKTLIMDSIELHAHGVHMGGIIIRLIEGRQI